MDDTGTRQSNVNDVTLFIQLRNILTYDQHTCGDAQPTCQIYLNKSWKLVPETHSRILGKIPKCQSLISADDVSNLVYDLRLSNYFSKSTMLAVTLIDPSLGKSLMPFEYERTRHSLIFFCGL